ncbi:hypothetical protein GIB67_037253 [Kingdonia uniflora]|uniref:CCT domain-containing protein n=1 Tax=Kingdonia uniflora TaxID=39325 RepID=A0A7J7MSD5_9MAGN|nr:hypothetical protein GIB67_037253 [Kingdonia uniflora]
MASSNDSDMQLLSKTFFSFDDDDPPTDIHQIISNNSNHNHPSLVNDPTSSVSPPSQELNNMSLTQFQALPTNGVTNFSDLEEPFVNVADKMLMRSFSSQSLDQKPGFLFQPRFNSVLETPYYEPQVFSSPESIHFNGPMRRVYSTGDLQRMMSYGFIPSSPLSSETLFMGNARFKSRRYSPEERKEKIHKYRSKRPQRNYSRTVKYACRKTLADSRPRIRGRFARNDESEEIPKVARINGDGDELWVMILLFFFFAF